MAGLEHVDISPLSIECFKEVLTDEQWRRVEAAIERAQTVLAGRLVWNVNSTARGGGVAEMLYSLIGYARGSGVDARWAVIPGDTRFFEITKRIHNRMHGSPGDGGPLGDQERADYESTLQRSATELAELMRPGDIVLLHDPQTAGLVPALLPTGAAVAWRSHIGIDRPNELALEAWQFLLPYARQAAACIFSRREYFWGGVDDENVAIIPPSIDAFSVKNRELDPGAVGAILVAAGLVDGATEGPPVFRRHDDTPGRVDRHADLVEDAQASLDTPIVLQVSRWDRLKDPVGVIHGFAEHVVPRSDAHLVYAGPATAGVSDDPEGAEVFEESRAAWEGLSGEARARVHLASLPMHDAEENAAIVNALQRHARVVVQKSIAEGFGLTVSEAMWKSRPVVATRTGGIQDQIVHGESGLLVDDPHDLAAYGGAVAELLEDPEGAERMGEAAQRRVRDQFLGPRHLIQYLDLFERLPAAIPA